MSPLRTVPARCSRCAGALRVFALLCLTPCLWLLAPRASAQPAVTSAAPAAAPFTPFNFALLGDPQIGYGPGAELFDARRFAAVVRHVNAQSVPLSLVVGDLVQDRSLWQRWAFSWGWDQLQGQGLLLPGNHDVVDVASLKAYRAKFGRDYYDFVYNNCAFIVLNSETARDSSISSLEYAAQWDFIEAALRTHTEAKRTHVLLAMHRPPFVHAEDEPESGANWPPESRQRLLSLARQYGVRWLLAGHLHSTHRLQTADGLQVLVVPGSARSFDRSPIGYQLFRVEANGLQTAWVTVEESPAETWRIPGFHEWTPRLLDFSLRHWLLTVAYAWVGWIAWQRGQSLRGVRRGAPRVWRTVAWVLWAFAINLQLDLDEFIRECARLGARLTGVYPLRHLITGTVAIGLTVGGALWALRQALSARRDRWGLLATCLLAVPLAWLGLSVISHHDWEMLFAEEWWDLLSVLALTLICVSSRQSRPARA